MCGSLCYRRSTFERKLAERGRRMPRTQLRDFLQRRRELGQLAASPQRPHCAKLHVRGTADAYEVRMVGVREPVRPRARRGDDASLLEDEDGVARAGSGKDVRDRLGSLGVRDSVSSAVEDGKRRVFTAGNLRDEACAVHGRRTNLQVWRTRPADGTATEQRPPEIRAPTAR